RHLVRLRTQCRRVHAGPGSTLPILLCPWRGRLSPAAPRRQPRHGLSGRQEDHPWHAGRRAGPLLRRFPVHMTLSEYVLFASSSLFVIMDPIATVPLFLAMTPGDTAARRIQMARLACAIAAG